VKVLVTGGTGFIGPKVVRALREAGHDVRALVRDPARGAVLGCELAEGDMTDPASLRRAVDGCAAVIHLVSIITGRPGDFERVMTEGTEELTRAAAAAGVRRFVLMSALGTSEQTKDLVPYYRAKWEMEQTVKGSGIPYTIFRPSFVFGPNGGALQQFLRIARLAPVTPIVGPGTQRLQPIWVDDVAAHFAAAVALDAAAGRAFELGGPDVVDWNEFWARAKRALGTRRPSVHVPFWLMRQQTRLLELLPHPPVTRDQLKMLAAGDNVVTDPSAREVFGLPLVPLDEQLRRATAGWTI
jgi:NADH dehydrogenase